jgi:hypothetical protein
MVNPQNAHSSADGSRSAIVSTLRLTWGSLLLVLASIALCGCNGDEPAALTACDPFADQERPIALGELLGAGKDSHGTYYVVDSGDGDGGEPRVYVSDGDVLERQRIAGTASISTPDGRLLVFSILERDPDLTVAVEESGGETRMGVLEGDFAGRTFVIGEDGEELTAVPASEIADMELRNLPGDVVLEYAAELEDGRLLVVTRPYDDWSHDDFRIFLGPTARLEERTVHQVVRARDGGSTTIEFDLEEDHATAAFPVVFDEQSMNFEPGSATLSVSGELQELTRLDEVLGDIEYVCL